MVFTASESSSSQMANDINRVMEALGRMLSKFEVEIPRFTSEPKLAPKDIDAWLAEEAPYIDVEVMPEREMLEGREQTLLTGGESPKLRGSEPEALQGTPPYPLLEAGATAEVQLQLGETHIRGLLPEIREALAQLPPAQIADLRQAIDPPALPPSEDIIDAEVIDIAVNDISQFHRNSSGVITLNRLNGNEPAPELEQEPTEQAQAPPHEAQKVVMTTEIQEQPQQFSHVEVRPVAEVEGLTGVQLNETGALHAQVLRQAPSVEVVVDENGTVKPSSALFDQVKATEDEVQTEVEPNTPTPELTPHAKAMTDTFFAAHDQQDAQRFYSEDDGFDVAVTEDLLLVYSKDNREKIMVIDREGDVRYSSFQPDHLEQFIIRCEAAFDCVKTSEQVEPLDLER